MRFDLALANLGSVDFTTTDAHPQEACTGISSLPNILSMQMLTDIGAITTLNIPSRGLCLFDGEVASGTPTGTPASNANYTICNSSIQGISVGWQAVYPADLDTVMIDITSLLDTALNAGGGLNYTLRMKFQASLLGNFADVQLDYVFFLPFDDRCFPAPQYTVTTPASLYVDASGHSVISNSLDQNFVGPSVQLMTFNLGPFDTSSKPLFCYDATNTPQSGKAIFIRANGLVSFDTLLGTGTPALDENDNTIPAGSSAAADTFFLANSFFPFWDAVFYVNSSYSAVRYFENSTDIIITWENVDRKVAGSNPFTFQMNLKSNLNVIYSYQLITNSNPAWGNGASASVGLCAGLTGDPGPNPNANIASVVSNNCNRYSINTGNKLDISLSVVFTRNSDIGRVNHVTRPTANIQGPTSGAINSSYTFTANGSALHNPTGDPVLYQWIWGDGSLPTFGFQANHTFRRVATFNVQLKIFDGIQFSVLANSSVVMGNVIATPNTTTNDGNTDGLIALAVLLPILFVLVIVVLLAIFLFVFFRRHILSKGGAWWEEDPIYLNLEEQQ